MLKRWRRWLAERAIYYALTIWPDEIPPVIARSFATDDSWARWASEIRHLAQPGWAPCRFANRLGPSDGIAWVFGITRAEFGVWKAPFVVLQNEPAQRGELLLAAVTHLPTGMGVGVFAAQETACEAVSVIEQLEEWRAAPVLGPDQNHDAHERWTLLMQKARTAWQFNGIQTELDLRAHAGNDTLVPVWRKHDPFEARPERMS